MVLEQEILSLIIVSILLPFKMFKIPCVGPHTWGGVLKIMVKWLNSRFPKWFWDIIVPLSMVICLFICILTSTLMSHSKGWNIEIQNLVCLIGLKWLICYQFYLRYLLKWFDWNAILWSGDIWNKGAIGV